MKQSSIEWLVEQYQYKVGTCITKVMEEEINQAKQMHKQEIEDAFNDGINDECLGKNTTPEEFYKNTYEKTR